MTLIIKKRLCNKTKKKETNLEIYNAKILPKLYIQLKIVAIPWKEKRPLIH